MEVSTHPVTMKLFTPFALIPFALADTTLEYLKYQNSGTHQLFVSKDHECRVINVPANCDDKGSLIEWSEQSWRENNINGKVKLGDTWYDLWGSEEQGREWKVYVNNGDGNPVGLCQKNNGDYQINCQKSGISVLFATCYLDL